tara:strand:+ start:4510 stop:5007 length:498 start_codon:yes stop_codon:yes gene_type:complete
MSGVKKELMDITKSVECREEAIITIEKGIKIARDKKKLIKKKIDDANAEALVDSCTDLKDLRNALKAVRDNKKSIVEIDSYIKELIWATETLRDSISFLMDTKLKANSNIKDISLGILEKRMKLEKEAVEYLHRGKDILELLRPWTYDSPRYTDAPLAKALIYYT